MGSSNDLPNSPTSNQTVSETLLADIKHNLQTFQQDLVGQLTADVGRLQAEKVELLTAINELKREQKALQTQQQSALSQQQVAQQKIWAKQLAEALATRLYVLLAQKIDQTGAHNANVYDTPPPIAQPSLGMGHPSSLQVALPPPSSSTTDQALSVLNTKLNSALGSLQQDLGQTNSPLIQQISQAESAESQGEVLLNQLVTRLRTQLHDSGSRLPQAPPPRVDSLTLNITDDVQPTSMRPSVPQPPTPFIPPAPQTQTPFVQHWAEKLNLSHFQLGLILVLFSTLALSLHNVAVGVIGAKSQLFGVLPETGGCY